MVRYTTPALIWKQWIVEINFGTGYIALQIVERLHTLKLDCQLNEDEFAVTTQENKPVQTNRPQTRQSMRLGDGTKDGERKRGEQ